MPSKFAKEYNQQNESKRQGFRIRWGFDLKAFVTTNLLLTLKICFLDMTPIVKKRCILA